MSIIEMATDETVQLIRDSLRQLQTGQRDTIRKLDQIDEKLSYTNGKVGQALRDIEDGRKRLDSLDKDFRGHVKWGEDVERHLRESLQELSIEEANAHEQVKDEKQRSQRMKELFIKYVVPALIGAAGTVATYFLIMAANASTAKP